MGNGYIVRFVRRDGKPDEEYFYRTAEEARRHFDMFTNDDSGLYDRIEVEAQSETEKVQLPSTFERVMCDVSAKEKGQAIADRL